MEAIAKLFARRFTPEERAAIDADLAKIRELIVQRRDRELVELEALEASARSEIRAIEVQRQAVIYCSDIEFFCCEAAEHLRPSPSICHNAAAAEVLP